MAKYVKVSPDYHGDGWWDPKSQKWFKKELGVITLEDNVDMTNITRYLRFNYLAETSKPAEEKTTVQKVMKVTASQVLAEEKAPVVEAAVEEEVVVETVEEVKVEVEDKDGDGKAECPYCGKEYKDLAKHLKSCKKNPDNQ